MQAKRVMVRVSPDGAMEIVDDDDSNSELRHTFGEMPAMLAREPVAVGEKWTRENADSAERDPGAIGSVRATFRLDSLGRNGDNRLHLHARHDGPHEHPERATFGPWLYNLCMLAAQLQDRSQIRLDN